MNDETNEYTTISETISSDDLSSYNIISNNVPLILRNSTIRWKEFETHMPDLNVVKDMCVEYPAMKKAYDHFVNTYLLLKDDYDSKTK